MTYGISLFSILAILGLLLTTVFLIGVFIQAANKKPFKIWVWGLIISIILTLIANAFAFSDLFYQATAEIITPTIEQPTKTELTWEEAVELIKSCQVGSVFQDHSRNVSLSLKDGTSRSTVEPEIDTVLEEAKQAEGKCGPILMATE